jgi:hypothetical protein
MFAERARGVDRSLSRQIESPYILPALVITGFQLSALPLIDALRIHVASLDVRGNVTIIQNRSIDTLIPHDRSP